MFCDEIGNILISKSVYYVFPERENHDTQAYINHFFFYVRRPLEEELGAACVDPNIWQ